MAKQPTTQVLKQLLTDNNIVIPPATKKTELFLMLFDAGTLKREEVFPPRKKS